eukprot:6888775-Karenia_brevis.AAC.1
MGSGGGNHWRAGSSQTDHNSNTSHCEFPCLSSSWKDGVSSGAPVDSAESCRRQILPILEHLPTPGRTWPARENGN